MSEFTDYMVYHSQAATLPELRAEVIRDVGQAIIIPYFKDGRSLDQAETEARLAQGSPPRWVILLAPFGMDIAPRNPTAGIFVLEDFASWRLATWCGGRHDVLRFGSDDGYAAGWFAANLRETGLTGKVEGDVLDHLSACLGVATAELGPLLAHDRPWDFLESLGVPALQMMDAGLVDFDLHIPATGNSAVFPWETAFDWDY